VSNHQNKKMGDIKMNDINTHNLICDFGKHKGVPYTQIPVSYLLWMVNQKDHSRKQIAEAELKRRGTVLPKIDISGHAIDRASLYCLDIWQATRRDKEEGLHAWLVSLAIEALEIDQQDDKGSYLHKGLRFVFEQDGIWPVLKTVMKAKKKTLEVANRT
jgi:hypothetical protein